MDNLIQAKEDIEGKYQEKIRQEAIQTKKTEEMKSEIDKLTITNKDILVIKEENQYLKEDNNALKAELKTNQDYLKELNQKISILEEEKKGINIDDIDESYKKKYTKEELIILKIIYDNDIGLGGFNTTLNNILHHKQNRMKKIDIELALKSLREKKYMNTSDSSILYFENDTLEEIKKMFGRKY